MHPLALIEGSEMSLSTPHERELAEFSGLNHKDGLVPWAAMKAPNKQPGWAFMTPCYWKIGSHSIIMEGEKLESFSKDQSQSLLKAILPYLKEDGIEIHYLEPDCWLARHDDWATLPTASLDRVAGRNVENWLPRGDNAANLRRLQTEIQMLLYTHSINDARVDNGLSPVNSFWLSGTGELPASYTSVPINILVIDTLKRHALNENWGAWVDAWQQIDKKYFANKKDSFENTPISKITFCGERNSRTYVQQKSSLPQRLLHFWQSSKIIKILQEL